MRLLFEIRFVWSHSSCCSFILLLCWLVAATHLEWNPFKEKNSTLFGFSSWFTVYASHFSYIPYLFSIFAARAIRDVLTSVDSLFIVNLSVSNISFDVRRYTRKKSSWVAWNSLPSLTVAKWKLMNLIKST